MGGFNRRQPTNVAVLTLANLGLLSFFLGGVEWVFNGWDKTAFFCVAGYVFCGLALAVPSMTFAKTDGSGEARDDQETFNMDNERRHWRVFAAILNVVGLVLGILGSLLYSPGFDTWATSGELKPYVREEDFEMLTDQANVIWALSFVVFPIGSGLFLLDKKKTLEAKATARGVKPPGYFSSHLYLYTWIEIALVIIAVGGLLFCFDENRTLLVTSLVLFLIGGSIKAGLMFHELKNFVGNSCEGVVDADDETTPLLSDSSGSVSTSSLLGDPEA